MSRARLYPLPPPPPPPPASAPARKVSRAEKSSPAGGGAPQRLDTAGGEREGGSPRGYPMAGAGDAPGPSGLETFLVESTGAGGAQTGWLKVDGAVRWLSAGGGKVDLYEVPEGTGRTRPAAGDLKLVYSFEADWVKRVVAERSREKPAFVVSASPPPDPTAASHSRPPPRTLHGPPRSGGPGVPARGVSDLHAAADSHEAEPLPRGARAHVQMLREHEAGGAPDLGRAASSVRRVDKLFCRAGGGRGAWGRRHEAVRGGEQLHSPVTPEGAAGRGREFGGGGGGGGGAARGCCQCL